MATLLVFPFAFPSSKYQTFCYLYPSDCACWAKENLAALLTIVTSLLGIMANFWEGGHDGRGDGDGNFLGDLIEEFLKFSDQP